MGRIFKFLGSTPVSFDIVPKQVEVPKPPIIKGYSKPKFVQTEDKFVSNKVQQKSNAFIKMRNGIGKLMSHFSKVDKKV